MQTSRPDETAGNSGRETDTAGDRATVAVIIPTFNQARFLGEAIKSVLAQTHPAAEIIVVDDGSTDNPETVVAEFPSVRLIRQDNRGLSAARNTGLRSCQTTYVVFLDSDDRLLPNALEAGLACMATRPDCAFVSGGCRLISEDGDPLGPDRVNPIEGDPHLSLLRANPIVVHSVLFRRDILLSENGFDETLRRCEDYDLYLRIVPKYSIAIHREIVAEYRRHGTNMSNDYVGQLKVVLHVLDRHEARIIPDAPTRAALREGRANARVNYAYHMLLTARAHWRTRRDFRKAAKELIRAARWSPSLTVRTVLEAFGRRAGRATLRALGR